jgi:putative DNA primase/helicase
MRQELEAIVAHCMKSLGSRSLGAMVNLARSEEGIPVLPEQLDLNPWLFNCPNGTIDLRTGELRPHRREDYITKLCPTEYIRDAICDTWLRFLDAIFQRDEGLSIFVQRLLGRSLTGDVSEQVLPIFWGTGANGKSTLINAVLETMGAGYAMKANADLLMASRGERHPTELAQLFRIRLVVASETQQGRHLNESLIKDLTGGEPIRARRMREDFWEFSPTHKVILLTNHKPRVQGTDEGIWRRLRLVPFEVCFWDPTDPAKKDRDLPPELRQDKQLPQKLRAEAPGILAWMVQGCLDWQREGLTMPEKVRVATAEYRCAEDAVAQFLEECCLTGNGVMRCRASAIYGAYRQWSERAGEKPLSRDAFGDAMTQRRFERQKSNGVWYLGVTLREPDGAGGGDWADREGD